MARTDKNNVTRYWWDSHIPGLSLMSADFTSHDYATHTHDAFVIAISELGSAKIRSRGTVETVHSTRLFVSNQEEPQSATPVRGDTIQVQPTLRNRVYGVTK